MVETEYKKFRNAMRSVSMCTIFNMKEGWGTVSTMMIVMIFSIILCFIVIGITVLVTNKAYDVLPNSLKIDPHPDEDKEKNKQPK